RRLVRTGAAGLGKVLGASMRNGSYQRAVRRITRPS
ncbi:histidine kinase, partial [Serratia marcescens subsp. marcescens ATCC 13880]